MILSMEQFELTFDSLYEEMQDLSFPGVRRWKERHPGAKSVAFFPVYPPVELVHAAGMLPVLLSGAGPAGHTACRFPLRVLHLLHY